MQPSTDLHIVQLPPATQAVSARVLAIHGSASNSKMWRPFQAALQGQSEVIAPDLDGYSPHMDQAGPQDRLDQLSKILHAHPEPMDLVAHSFGGAIALKLANMFPHRVRRVAIYDPVVPIPTPDGGAGLPSDLQACLSGVDTANAQALMQTFFEYWGSAKAWQAMPEDKKQRLLGYHPAFLRDVSELTSGKWSVLRSRFKGPVTVFRGTASKAAARQSCERVAAIFAQAKWIEISGLDHLAPMTNPNPVNAALVDCLGEDTAGPARQLTCQLKSAA